MKENGSGHFFSFGDFELDGAKRRLLRKGQTIPLNSKTFDLLLTLIENHGEILSKDELLNQVWTGQFVEENNLTVHISALRKALGERKGENRFLVTIPGKGYKFIGELNNQNDDEIVVERHSVERIIIEEEIISDSPNAIDIYPQQKLLSQKKQSSPKFFYAIFGIILLIILGGIWFWKRMENPLPKLTRFTKITSSGKITNATMTNDGIYAVFSQNEKDGESLWLKHIATGSQNQILKTQSVNYVGLTTSPDNNFIYATVFSGEFPDPQVWKIPILGGATEQIPNMETGVSVSISPDGKRMAFTESHSSAHSTMFTVADVTGENKKFLVVAKDGERSFPIFKSSPVAWSPNGNEIASVIEEKTADGATKASILLIDPANGNEKHLTENRWDYIFQIDWADAENLVLTASTMNKEQIWSVSRRTGEAKPITNDLSNYSWVSSSNNNILAVQKNIVSKVNLANFDESAKSVQSNQIFEESGNISNVNWTTDGKIVFSSTASGQPEIWRINSDGSDKTQLTVNSGVSFGFSVSPIDNSIIFCSTKNGKHSIYFADSEGKNIAQIVEGTEDVFPNFTPDGNSIIFQRGLNNKILTLWRYDLKDKKLTQLTQKNALFPTISPDGNKIAHYFMDSEVDNLWRIKLISGINGDFLSKLNLPKEATERKMRWHPNGKFISQIANQGDNIKLLFLPITENDPTQSFDLGKGGLQWFEWSKDGKKIVYSQSVETQDIVLLSQ